MAKRVYPFAVVHPVYDKDTSVYPDKVRVPMEDGKVIDYFRESGQHESVLKPLLDAFDKTCAGGNKYKTKGRGKRTGRILEEEKNNE